MDFDWGLIGDAGLVIIVVAWAIQAVQGLRGKRRMHPWFVGLYALGTGLLVVSGHGEFDTVAILNLIIVVLALIVFASIRDAR